MDGCSNGCSKWCDDVADSSEYLRFRIARPESIGLFGGSCQEGGRSEKVLEQPIHGGQVIESEETIVSSSVKYGILFFGLEFDESVAKLISRK
jgi:hypothetical protein